MTPPRPQSPNEVKPIKVSEASRQTEWTRPSFMRDDVGPATIDASGEYPQAVIDTQRSLGAFGMKIPREYGGLGLSQIEYQKVMERLGSCDANLIETLKKSP